LDADLVGVSGAQEPRKVILIVAVDANDIKKQLSGTVCVHLKDRQVCREWNTGKLIMDYNEP
jgi:hypothetical protein